MTYTISDTFSDSRGRYINWDTTMQYDGSKGFLATQQHVDLRNFSSRGGAENWSKTGTGFNALTTGPIATYKNWDGLSMLTSGAAVSTTLVSSMPTMPVDISLMDVLSIIFPDYNVFDGTSYVQLCSNAAGDFTSHNSATVAFSSNGSVMPQLELPISSFANAGFDNTKVTGIKIVLTVAAAPAASQTCIIMAIRALKTAWTEKPYDFDTKGGVLKVTPTLSGADPVGTPIPLIRGDGTKNDPIPADVGLNIYFNSGGSGGWNATGATYNKVELYFRETKDVGSNSGSWIVARLKWNDAATHFETERYDDTAGVMTNTTPNTTTIGAALSQDQGYLLTVSLTGTGFSATIYKTDAALAPTDLVWVFSGYSSSDYPYRNGRVGLALDFTDRDAYVDQFEAAVTGYANLITKTFQCRTPVDGAQLAAVCAPDQNLWQSFSGSDLVVDRTKSISGKGSYRTTLGVITNQFIVEDWTNTYLSLNIWLPQRATASNTPMLSLVTPVTSIPIPTKKLLGFQWNSVYVDLGLFRDQLTGSAYQIAISQASQPDTPLGAFWIDNMMIGRRRVAWKIRTEEANQWRTFGRVLNSPNGAVHFPPLERGKNVQLRAEALTSDAWVAAPYLKLRFAQLGNFVFDQAYATS